jgi:HSP20 family molecular chaperone IbpA
MAQKESKSFFERLTGARILHRNEEDQEVEYNHEQPSDAAETSSQEDLEEVIEEPEKEKEEEFSDENTGRREEEQEGQLTVDVFHDDSHIIVQSTVAGVTPEDLDVSITNDMVTIRGERRRTHKVDPEDYFYQECYWGPFSRSIILPVEIDADRAEARIKNGILTIKIPKANTAMTKKLTVKAS